MLSTAVAITWKEIGLAWFHRLVIYRQILMPTNHKLHGGCDKSFADDLVTSRYCKHESSLCATICWDFSLVITICSSFSGPTLRALLLTTYCSQWQRLFFFEYFFTVSEVRPLNANMGTVAILAQGTLSGWCVSQAFLVGRSIPGPGFSFRFSNFKKSHDFLRGRNFKK